MRFTLSLFGVTLALSLGRDDTPSPLDEEGPLFRATPGDLLDPSPLSSFPLGFTPPSCVEPWDEE